MHFLEYNSYKNFLKAQVDERKSIQTGVSFQAMAAACKIQKTYLSRVLNDRSSQHHLNADQLFLASKFLGLNQKERSYLELLFEWERAQEIERKNSLFEKLQALKNEYQKNESVLELAQQSLELERDQNEYYLNPHYQLIHMFYSVPTFASDPKKIQSALGLGSVEFNRITTKLLRMGLLENFKGAIKASSSKKMHLKGNSPILVPYRSMIRLKALQRMQQLASDETHSFSVCFSANESTKEQIRLNFLEFLKSVEKLVSQCKKIDGVYQLNFDLLPWSN